MATMVHEKKKSGDPDYDDKKPIADQTGRLATSPDGREVIIHEATGPVDRYTGEHVSLDGPTAEDLDKRPAPGGQAEEESEVQTYSVKDTPMAPQYPAVGDGNSAAKNTRGEGMQIPDTQSEEPATSDDEKPSADAEKPAGVDASPKPARSTSTAKRTGTK
jgi:hypothetical protein